MKNEKSMTKLKEKFKRIGLDENGREKMDSRPVSHKLKTGQRQESLADMVKRCIRDAGSGYAEANDMDTWDEADDFGLEEDPEVASPWEVHFDPYYKDEVYAKDIVARRLSKAKIEHEKAKKALDFDSSKSEPKKEKKTTNKQKVWEHFGVSKQQYDSILSSIRGNNEDGN